MAQCAGRRAFELTRGHRMRAITIPLHRPTPRRRPWPMGCAILWLSGSAPGLAASPESAVPPASMRSPARAPAPAPLAMVPAGAPAAATASAKSTTAISTNCLDTGDGYLRAHLGGAIEARIDWPNSGTRCQGEPKDRPPGVRLSFQRARPGSTDLLFVFGVTGIREGKAARDVGVNLTVIVQGTNRIYGTLGDSRCTVDSLTQRPLKVRYAYRVSTRFLHPARPRRTRHGCRAGQHFRIRRPRRLRRAKQGHERGHRAGRSQVMCRVPLIWLLSALLYSMAAQAAIPTYEVEVVHTYPP